MNSMMANAYAWFARTEATSYQTRKALSSADWGLSLIIWLVSSALLLYFESYLQNTNIATTNGLWESIELRRWIGNPKWTSIDFGNAIYLPIYGFLVEALDKIGVFRHLIWRQMAVLDACFAGLGLAAVYIFVRSWIGSRITSIATVVLYGGSAFYLLCSVISEWDMPSQSFILISTLLACCWFNRPTITRLAVVAVLFSVSWLFEWRFLFPALPPLLLGLFLAPARLYVRILRPFLFLVFMCFLPAIFSALYFLLGRASVTQTEIFFLKLFWAGKGVGSGWGGFTLAKFPLAVAGFAESLIGARNTSPGYWSSSVTMRHEVIAGSLIFLILITLAVQYAWRHRHNDAVVVASSILGGTLAAGTVFNLYSQPQDPQMLLNVMIWTVPAWALAVHSVLAMVNSVETRTPSNNRYERLPTVIGYSLLGALLFVPFVYNVRSLAARRGFDQKYERLTSEIFQHFDPRRTVFLYQGFAEIITWQFVLADGSWKLPSTLPPAPSRHPTFKIIAAVGIPVNHPQWTIAHQVDALKTQIDEAMARGYQVVAGPKYVEPNKGWVNSFLSVAPAALPQAMRNMLKRHFDFTPAYKAPLVGEYSVVTRKADS